MPYPNQPTGISDQAWRVASNIAFALSRGDLDETLGSTAKLARLLEMEYGERPDSNLSIRVDELEAKLTTLRSDIQKQNAAYKQVRNRK